MLYELYDTAQEKVTGTKDVATAIVCATGYITAVRIEWSYY